MNRHNALGWAGALALLAQTAYAASVADQAEWPLQARMKGHATMACSDAAPSPEKPTEQAIPTPITARNWAAKLKFAQDGSFQFQEIDASLKDQPNAKWAVYKGTWTQKGERLSLVLDPKSAAALIGTVDGGSKCGSNAPCFDTKHAKLTGWIRDSQAHGSRLSLNESIRLAVTSVKAKGQFKCLGRWHYYKAYKSP